MFDPRNWTIGPKEIAEKNFIFRKGSKYYWEQSLEHKAETHSILTLEY